MLNLKRRGLMKNLLILTAVVGIGGMIAMAVIPTVAAVCTACQGTGTFSIKCNWCNGTGKLDKPPVKCSFCNGKGYPKCNSCNGTGQKP